MGSTKNTLKHKNSDRIANSELANKLSKNNVMSREIVKSSINYGDLVGKLVEKSYRKYGQEFSLDVISLFTHLFEEIKEPSHELLCCAIQIKHIENNKQLDLLGLISDGVYGMNSSGFHAEDVELMDLIKLLERFLNMSQDALETEFLIFANRYNPLTVKERIEQLSIQNTNEFQRCILIVDLLKKMQLNIRNLNSIIEPLSELRMLSVRL
jgi:hypothetical protein